MKLGAVGAASDDMGSLAFSADSQDVMESNSVSGVAHLTADTSADRSVEVVLVEESRDEQT